MSSAWTRFLLFPLALSLIFWAGCAHVPTEPNDPAVALQQICSVGSEQLGVQGDVWLKAHSQEASGQFPAAVSGKAPSSLRLEVTNLLGGTEAVIRVEGSRYTIHSSKKGVHSEEGYGSWGGIPLNWAPDLFLGRYPCPTPLQLKSARVSYGQGEQADRLIAEVPASLEGAAEKFVYEWDYLAGHPWVEMLHWERMGPLGGQVDFHFSHPGDHSVSPREWEAKSPRGDVKVRWRDRTFSSPAR